MAAPGTIALTWEPGDGAPSHWRRSSTPRAPPPACAMPRQQPSRRARRTTASSRLSGGHAARGRRHPPRYCFPDGIGPTPQAKSDRPASADRAIASRGIRSRRAHPWGDRFDGRGPCGPSAASATFRSPGIGGPATASSPRRRCVGSDSAYAIRPLCTRRLASRLRRLARFRWPGGTGPAWSVLS